jgi:uncharacterized protein YhbP (UPF0306 family)
VASWADLLGVLEESTTLTLATLDADGTPRATPLYFAVEATPEDGEAPFAFLFLSDPSSFHIRNLERDPRSAVALYPSETDWRRLRGAQAKGRTEAVAEDERETAMAVYRSKVSAVEDVPEAVAHSRLYRFLPTWIRCIDNRKGFGRHEEWTWP